jgi:predicted methyltransferase
MNHLISILMAALLLGACQQDGASNSEVNATPETESAGTTPDLVANPAVDAGANDQRLKAIQGVLKHPDRPTEDMGRDSLRKPGEVLAFSGIEPGMCVLDLFTAGGYYAELLSRLVGDEGEVWAQNPPQFYDRFGSADLDFRLADRRLPNVERQDRPLEDLSLPDEHFDAVVAALVLHDLFWLTNDVPAVLGQIHASLKPGGVMLVTDHAAPPGTGTAMAKDPEGKHRIEDQEVTLLMEEAGFELVATSEVLRVAEDDRSLAFFEMKGAPTDRFVHLYRKPLPD